MNYKPLPIGVDNFEDMIINKYYYVDKTLMIKELLDLKGKVNLFTRPRRFGKSLNMSMIQYFFEDRGSEELNNYNKNLFSGLNIMKEGDKYTSYIIGVKLRIINPLKHMITKALEDYYNLKI